MKNEIKERLTKTIQFLVLIIGMFIFTPLFVVEGCTIFYFEWLIWGRKTLLTWELYFKILEKLCSGTIGCSGDTWELDKDE